MRVGSSDSNVIRDLVLEADRGMDDDADRFVVC